MKSKWIILAISAVVLVALLATMVDTEKFGVSDLQGHQWSGVVIGLKNQPFCRMGWYGCHVLAWVPQTQIELTPNNLWVVISVSFDKGARNWWKVDIHVPGGAIIYQIHFNK